MSTPLEQALTNPEGRMSLTAELDRLDAEDSLLDFMKQGWEALEPGQEFVHGWAVEAICDALQAVTDGQLTRLLINVPPGCTKSMTTNVFWPAWEWGPRCMPHLRYISAAYANELSIRDNLRGRDLILSEWYQGNWGDRFFFKTDQNAKIRYENNHAGWRQASSTGAGLTGHRGDRIILDDPHAVRDVESDAVREDALRWFSETLPTRLNKLGESAIVVIMQRVHERDVSGLILAKELGYEHLMLPMEFEAERRCFVGFRPSYMPEATPVRTWWHASEDSARSGWRPAPPDGADDDACEERYDADPRVEDGELLWPERFDRDAVEQLKAAFRSWGGTYAEAGQLQQRPAPRGGGMFKRDDFQILDSAPAKLGRVVRGWDLAATKASGKFTAGAKVTIHDGRVIILDVQRKQGSPGEVETMIRSLADQDGRAVQVDFPQDPGQAGKAQVAAFAKMLQGHDFTSSPETGKKEDRARPLAAQAEAGNVYLVRGPWNDAFINEACLFPNGEFSDQIDAVSRAHANLLRRRPRRVGAGPKLFTS